jgi:hypothetical protein
MPRARHAFADPEQTSVYRQWVLNIAVAVFVNRHAGGAIKTLLTEVRDPGAFRQGGDIGRHQVVHGMVKRPSLHKL